MFLEVLAIFISMSCGAIIATWCWWRLQRPSVRCPDVNIQIQSQATSLAVGGVGPGSVDGLGPGFAGPKSIYVSDKGAKYHTSKACRGLAAATSTIKKYTPCEICAHIKGN